MILKKITKRLLLVLGKKVSDNEGLGKVLGNINWLTFGVVIRDIVGIFITAWIARYLGPTRFGMMNYALAFVALFSTLSTLGLDDISIRNLVSKPEKKGEYLGSVFFLKLLGSMLLFVISSLSILFVKPGDSTIQLFVCIIAFGYIFKSIDVIDLFFQSEVRSKFSVYARTLSFSVITLIRIILILAKAPLWSFVLMNTLDLFLISVLYLSFYFKNGNFSFSKWRIRKEVMKELLSDCWPLIIGGFMVMIYMKIDQVMIGNMLTEKDLGLYSAAAKLSEAWYFIPTVITASLFPAILNAKKKDENLYRKRLQILYDIFTWFSIAVALVVMMLSPFIIRIMYGNDYIEAAPVLSVHIWAGIGVFLGSASGKYLISENLTKISLYKSIVGAVLNVVLNMILIPRIGIMGAALSTMVSYIASTFFILFFKESRETGWAMLRSFNIFKVIKDFKNAEF